MSHATSMKGMYFRCSDSSLCLTVFSKVPISSLYVIISGVTSHEGTAYSSPAVLFKPFQSSSSRHRKKDWQCGYSPMGYIYVRARELHRA
jgi:hypothetical protein